MAAGIVTSLARWPVKSLGGERAGALRLDGRGIAGDRGHALVEAGGPAKHVGRLVTIRQAPRMLHWRASYPDLPGDALHVDAVPLPEVTAPDGTRFAWDDPGLPQALADDLDRPVALTRSDGLLQDLHDSILVTTQASLDATSVALGRALDLRRFRTNIHVELDAPPFAEERWEGRRLAVGDVVLELLHPCARCVIPTRDPDTGAKHADVLRWLSREHGGLFGINARAHGPARVAVGDAVRLV